MLRGSIAVVECTYNLKKAYTLRIGYEHYIAVMISLLSNVTVFIKYKINNRYLLCFNAHFLLFYFPGVMWSSNIIVVEVNINKFLKLGKMSIMKLCTFTLVNNISYKKGTRF